jgi:hypothetical protein
MCKGLVDKLRTTAKVVFYCQQGLGRSPNAAVLYIRRRKYRPRPLFMISIGTALAMAGQDFEAGGLCTEDPLMTHTLILPMDSQTRGWTATVKWLPRLLTRMMPYRVFLSLVLRAGLHGPSSCPGGMEPEEAGQVRLSDK